MNCCNGPCDQGRRPCPTPEACGMPEEPQEEAWYGELVRDTLTATAAIMIIGAVVLMVLA